MGRLFCMRTAPSPLPLASHSTMNGFSKSGSASTGALVITAFNFAKARVASSLHLNVPFFSREAILSSPGSCWGLLLRPLQRQCGQGTLFGLGRSSTCFAWRTVDAF